MTKVGVHPEVGAFACGRISDRRRTLVDERSKSRNVERCKYRLVGGLVINVEDMRSAVKSVTEMDLIRRKLSRWCRWTIT